MSILDYFKTKKQSSQNVSPGLEAGNCDSVFVHPASFAQSSEDSIVSSDGTYDLSVLSNNELQTVLSVIKTARSGKYPHNAEGLGLANESYPIVYKPRYILHEIIIQQYSNSSNPLDILAVAAAYKTKGAFGRKQAILYFERWLGCKKDSDQRMAEKYYFDAREPFFSYNLAQLYMQEHRLDEALHYALIAEQRDLLHAPVFPLLVEEISKRIELREKMGSNYKTRAYKPSARVKSFEASVSEAARQIIASYL